MSKEAKLGLFVIVVLAVFLFFTINMGSIFFSRGQRHVRVLFDNIGTLEVGAPVKQAGFDVGEVDSISLQTVREPTPATFIIVDALVSDTAVISPDSQASIQTLGMMGEKYIEITFGSMDGGEPVRTLPGGVALEEEAAIVIEGHGPVQLDQVIENAVALSNEVQKAIQSFNVIIGDASLQTNIVLLIDNLKQFSDDLNGVMGGEQKYLQSIMVNLEVASAKLGSLVATAELMIVDAHGMVQENRPALNKTLDNVSVITQDVRENLMVDIKEISKEIKTFSAQLNQSTERANQILAKFDGLVDNSRPNVESALKNVSDMTAKASQASGRLDQILEQVQSKDGGLVHELIYDKELAKSTKSTITRASGFFDDASVFADRFNIIAEMSYFPDRTRFNPDDNYVRADFGLQFDISDELYFYAGGNNLGSSNELEAQIGYRWGPFAFHGGMIESEVGLGVDWNVLPKIVIGAEGLGITSQGEERIDAYSEFHVWDKIYITGGVQDIFEGFYPNIGVRVRF